jgi:hypothetical protein
MLVKALRGFVFGVNYQGEDTHFGSRNAKPHHPTGLLRDLCPDISGQSRDAPTAQPEPKVAGQLPDDIGSERR